MMLESTTESIATTTDAYAIQPQYIYTKSRYSLNLHQNQIEKRDYDDVEGTSG